MIKFLKLIRFFAICITLMTIVPFQSWHVWSAAVNSVCRTADCHALASTYLGNMNKNMSPCTDFYDYVCHKWEKLHRRSESIDLWAIEDILLQKALMQMKKLLENTNSSTVENAKLLYKECTKLPYVEKSQPDAIKNIMTKIGNWPVLTPKSKELNVSWSSIDNQYIKKTAESALFDWNYAMINDKLKCPIITKLKQLESPYGELVRFHSWEQISAPKNHYKNFLINIIETLGPKDGKHSRNTIESDVRHVIAFRDKLREIIEALPAKPVYEILTIKDLQEWYNKEAQSAEYAKLDWLPKIRVMREHSSCNSTNEHTLVLVDKSYFKKVIGILKQTPDITIANHIHLYFAERQLLYPPETRQELDKMFESDFGVTGKLRYQLSRWQSCILNHDMPVTLRKMYIDAAFPKQNNDEVKEIFTEIKHLLQEEIARSTWLDKETKTRTKDKVKHISSTVDFPSWMSSPVADEYISRKEVDPLIPEAYFSYGKNKVIITASYLQSPVFIPNAPQPIKYGATAFTFGHEVYHSLDETVLGFTSDGRTFWSQQVLQKYQNQSQCLASQYKISKNEEIKKSGIDTWFMLPSTLSEDVADVMGAKLAYKGYRETLKKFNGTCSVLPGFENMGCDQLFFIAFANTFCADLTQSATKKWLLTATHSLARLRVNGVVSNMKEFGTAFGCNSKDSLMPPKRCDIWKD